MQVPTRKPGKFSNIKSDPLITEEKFRELERKLARLKQTRPYAANEVKRLAENGDFSENAEYQIAKGRLRRMNDEIDRVQFEIDHAEIIVPARENHIVRLGHTVTIASGDERRTYKILGSAETDPAHGIISHTSALGAVLLGRTVGDAVSVLLPQGEKKYTIVEIE